MLVLIAVKEHGETIDVNRTIIDEKYDNVCMAKGHYFLNDLRGVSFVHQNYLKLHKDNGLFIDDCMGPSLFLSNFPKQNQSTTSGCVSCLAVLEWSLAFWQHSVQNRETAQERLVCYLEDHG